MPTQTAIMLLSASSAFNGTFLHVPKQGVLQQDVAATFVKSQSDASLFNLPSSPYGYIPGFEVVGSTKGPTGGSSTTYTAFTDLLAHNNPVLFSTPSQLANEPVVGALGCNLFPNADTGRKDKLQCYLSDGAPFRYQGSFAICKYTNNEFNDLFFYDNSGFYGSGPPTGCTEVELRSIAT